MKKCQIIGTDVLPRKYSASEVEELVAIFRHDPEMPPEKFAGMLDVVKLLAHFEYMTAEEIEEEARAAYRGITL